MNKINLKYFICLICSSLLLYPTLNVFFFYGNIINNLDIRNVILILLPGIFAILTLGIFKWITEKDFELIQDNKVDENETTNSLEIKKNNRKKHVYFWGIAFVYTLIFGIVSFDEIAVKEKAFELAQKTLWTISSVSLSQEEVLEFQNEYDSIEQSPDYAGWIISIILSFLVFVPVFFAFNKFFIKQKMNNLRVLKKIYRGIEIILIIGSVMISVYYFVDIPEFKYSYEILDEGIVFNGYSDVREYNKSNSMVVPRRILGKKIVNISSLVYQYNDEILLPSTFPKEAISSIMVSFCKIHMYGEPIEWYEEDGIIYNIDGTEILYINDENLYIKEKVDTINPILIVGADFIKSIEVSSNNKKFFSYDNVLYYDMELQNENEEMITYTVGHVPQIKGGYEIIIPDEISGDVFILVGLQRKKITIPSTLNKAIEFKDINLVSEYKVQSGNTYYEAYDGSLYEKGLHKLVALRDYTDENEIKLPSEVNDISESCLEELIDNFLYRNKDFKIVIDKNNPNFVVEDGLIYNANKTKLLMPNSYVKSIVINENVEEISQSLIESTIKFEISEDNPYFFINEFGEINKKVE